MTYTCFPNQTPFPLPPGVTTPPSSPSFTENGPQLAANSIDIWWTLALVGDPGSFVDWLEAEISADVPVANWLSALISSESYPTELDLCELVGLLGLLPANETFVPEEEDPDGPVLLPYQETFYVEAPIRLAGSMFYIPGPVVLDQGETTAVVKAAAFAGSPIGDAVRSVVAFEELGVFTRLTAAVALQAEAEASITANLRISAEATPNSSQVAGVVFGLTVSKP
jgi:hypothetical protein